MAPWAIISAAGRGGVLELILDAGPMVKFVLLVLFGFSILSWAIITLKFIHVRVIKKESLIFMDHFWGGKSLDTIYRETKGLKHSPLAQVFKSGYVELVKVKRSRNNPNEEEREGFTVELGAVDNISRSLRRAQTEELTRLERYLSFLATTGSTAPFVGLFGTVWGIMNSFQQIGALGKVGMDVVAPGISEALIATAAGLAAAIPAVMAYNYFLARSREVSSEMDNFAADLLNIVERHFL